MKRLDSTPVDHQSAFRGRHLPGNGVWSYPPTPTRYLRCACGWRLVEIPLTDKAKKQAYTQFLLHALEMA